MTLHQDLSAAERQLVDRFQSGLPVTERPFEQVGAILGESESRTFRLTEQLVDRGVFRRIGPVLNPAVIGSSTLAALTTPEERIGDVAEVVSDFDQVNHNYARDHEWNVWFVLTAATVERRNALLDRIQAQTECPLLRLPMKREYDIDLEFPVANDHAIAREHEARDEGEITPTSIDVEPCSSLLGRDRKLLITVQNGLPLSKTPYRDLANELELSVDAVLETIQRLQTIGCIKRIGCIVNHHAVGFTENCMVVWDIPDDVLDDRGITAAQHPSVTYCCHRPRRPASGWPYNLFTMIHGRHRQTVEETIDTLAANLDATHARLHTTQVFKQTGVRYRELLPRPTEQSS
jgi:DNA-binding Lrp family transcriptional regulator